MRVRHSQLPLGGAAIHAPVTFGYVHTSAHCLPSGGEVTLVHKQLSCSRTFRRRVTCVLYQYAIRPS